MQLDDYFVGLRRAHDGKLPLNDDQRQALEHMYDCPLWIIAGPGTGKTHTLVWLVLKRILVDGISPSRIILTTFTRKAATELESRLILSRQKLVDVGVREAEHIDISQITLGTLHSICSRVLQDQRYEGTLRIRILEDELTQQFFLRRTRNPLVLCDDISFWQRFGLLDDNATFAPRTADRAEGAVKLFNRLTENSVDISRMLGSGDPHFTDLAAAYAAYVDALSREHRTDQAHLQRHFLTFLGTPEGEAWMRSDNHHRGGFTVVVDEYQDTNPIQEAIYFKLAAGAGDITVVGDDDQSLYRFRGAAVESLIDFDKACLHYLKKAPAQVNLCENRRSHPDIVNWVNRFILRHPKMSDPRARQGAE